MNKGATSSNSFQTHFVDIYEVLPEEVIKMKNKVTKKGLHKPIKLRELKRPQKSFSRQVSLEAGFSVLDRESKAKDERKVLRRSGRSFGGFDSANRAGGEARKGDFNIFRTKSTLSKQNSLLPTRKEREMVSQRTEGAAGLDESLNKSVPAGRYFAALRGPELDQVKDYEDILLPKDEIWPFLLRFPIGCFALAVLVSVSITYLLKCIYYFEAVKREYFHPVRVNFFFAPWVVCMFLAIGLPPMLAPAKLHPAIWCAFMGPYFFLELKIYGQWLSGGKRRLCKVVNPSSHLSVVGNFVGAILASKVGWIEAAKFLWSVGFAHYLVLLVTLYQRLPTSEALPKELHPVICFFIALFLYISLVVRINFFTGFRFSVAWWSYTFPVTTASVATIKYAEQVPSVLSKELALSLSFMSSAMVSVLFVSTLLHAFVWQTLFPNDLAIAITKRRLVKEKKPFKKVYDITRWTKQALTKNNSVDKENNGENQVAY
ncbi:hypothetical protein CRYUN_Cryun07bG0162400 [Craigia yunnanensis]